MKYLDKIDESCSLIGAVNTLLSNKDGVLKGYNTDMDGFLEPFKKKEIKNCRNKSTSNWCRRRCKSNSCRICKRKSRRSITILQTEH